MKWSIYIYINEKGISSFNPVEEKCVLISWTGSITGAGNAVPNQRTIVIPLSHLGSLPFTSSDSFALDCLLHEFGHTFDCVDHYCKNGEDPLENCGSEHCDFHAFSYPTERECEMSSWSPKYPAMREKMAEDIYCDECSSKIKTDLNNFPLEVD